MCFNNKLLIIGILMLATVNWTAAELQLTVDTEYPRRLELSIPVQEDSEFALNTSFGSGEFFCTTGHVGRITEMITNRLINISYGYKYKLGNSEGGATGTGTQLVGSVNSLSTVRIVSSLWAANPAYTIREVPAPISPDKMKWTTLTNITISLTTNATHLQTTNAENH